MGEKLPLFVYGTLRKHQGNHHLLAGSKCIAEQAWTEGQLFKSKSGLPILVASAGGRVYGELFEVNHRELESLDRLEGYLSPGQKNHYDRVEKNIHTDCGSHNAFVYVIPNRKKRMEMVRIEGGDWRVYRLLKESSNFLYFAYGSCMDHERFKSAGVDHHFQMIKGCGILDGYHLRFTRRSVDGGRADIVEEGGRVEGKVYEVTADCLEYLYDREGVSFGYYRPALVDIKLNSLTVVNVFTFVVVDKEEETAPPAHYLNEIVRGGSGLVTEPYLEELKKRLQASFNLRLEDIP